jgi:hypothetical protein
VVRVLSALVVSLGAVGTPPMAAALHPIHSTLTEISFDSVARVATVRVRAFADDWQTATARWSRWHPRPRVLSSDSLNVDYLTHMISLESAQGEIASLEWCGIQRTGAVLWLCLRGGLQRGLEGVRVADRVLNDLFDDEINIVQIESAGRRTSAVFTRKDVSKVLIRKVRK